MNTTRDDLVCLAKDLMMERGYNAVSFSDLSGKIGVSNAAIHYHFPTKEALAVKAIESYSEAMLQKLQRYDAGCETAIEKLTSYVACDEDMVKNGKICLCGMFYSEFSTLPKPLQAAVRELRVSVCRWLERVFADGIEDGSISCLGHPADNGALFFTTLEGAVLIARSDRDLGLFRKITARLLNNWRPTDAMLATEAT